MKNYYHDKFGPNRRKKQKRKRFILTTLAILLLIAIGLGIYGYRALFKNNVWIANGTSDFVFVRTNFDFEQFKKELYAKGLIIDRSTFEWVCNTFHLNDKMRPGRYELKEGMGNMEICRLLSSGRQVPVKLIFHNIRTNKQFAGKIGKQIEADSTELLRLLTDTLYLKNFNQTPATAVSLFIPNTYEMWWNTSAEEFIQKMVKEHDKFWNDERKQKANNLGFSIEQIVTIASIVEEETNKNDEKSRIAGVYINRLSKGMPLQADPTLKFAANDFTLKRILNIHKEINSPYNTYKNAGLPPGPICIPSIASVDAVLNAEKHYYLFFCARPDFSGYHDFASSYEQHQVNAARYRAALDRLNIR